MEDKKETKTPSKGPIIAIFVCLGLFVIIYAIYIFEAYKNNLWPMVKYGPPTDDPDAFNDYFTVNSSTKDPQGAIRPLGYVQAVDPTSDQTDIASDVLGQVCTWYNLAKGDRPDGFVTLPSDQYDKLCANMPS